MHTTQTTTGGSVPLPRVGGGLSARSSQYQGTAASMSNAAELRSVWHAAKLATNSCIYALWPRLIGFISILCLNIDKQYSKSIIANRTMLSRLVSHRHLLFVTGGTGIAPIRSMIDDLRSLMI